jgi:5-methylthioadenosine/S-adenosylhomocysteine deaminase
MTFDVLIHNGLVLTMNTAFDVVRDGLVAVKDGRIQRVEARSIQAPLPEAKAVIDAEGGIIMPGLVNTHTHLPMTLFRGLADDLPLAVWLQEHIFPAESTHITPENVRSGALLGCAELLLGGTTTLCDGYFYEDEVAEMVITAGLRAVLGQGVIDYPAPGVPDPSENVLTAAAFVTKYHDRSSRIRPSVFCHSPYTCSAATLQNAKAVARDFGVLFQIHVAETQAENNRSHSDNGASAIQYLDRLGILDDRTLLVHAVWVDEADIASMSARGSCVSHNPESNMKLASGIAPVHQFLAAGLKVGLGTDGCASNNDLDLFQEMDVAAKLHKVRTRDPVIMGAETVLKMATIEAAKAIGLDHEVGSLEIGKAADIVVVDTRKPHLTPLYNPVSHLVYAARSSDVRHVFVAGEHLVENRTLKHMDVEAILARVRQLSNVIGSRS